MPIPQLSSSSNHNKSWRDNKSKPKIIRKRSNEYHRSTSSAKRTKASSYVSARKHSGDSIISRFFGKIFRLFLALGFLGAVVGLLFGSLVFFRLSHSLPAPGTIMDREIAQTTKIFDRTGETLLYEIHGDKKRTLVTLDQIPQYVKDATIAVEDKNFYHHKGFSLWAMARTLVKNVLKGQKAGGSTLTQQLIKNAIFTSEKTYTRKIKEIILAYRVEQKFSKDEILQMYLNEIPYGSNAYGIEAASQKYFGKSAQDINLAEAVILAALPQAPSRYSPYGANRETLIKRQHYILDLMIEQGYITKEDALIAKNFELEFKSKAEKIIAPHFVMYIKEKLSEKYGEKMIEQGGFKIYTTLDLYKQQIAEETITEHIERIQEKNEAENAALLSIDPKTGQILAMVGSINYFSDEIDGQVNITTSERQPGSSLKPLIYAAAFKKGYTPDTILYDVITNFDVRGEDEDYTPHNYDSKEHGPVSLRKALAGSLNIPAVKAIYLAGVYDVLDLAEDMGYTTFSDRERFGLSLVLGGGEVKMIEHVNAYGAFAREGKLHPLTYILRIEDKEGKAIEEFKPQVEKQVMNPKVARMINDILSDNQARAYAFGTRNWLFLDNRTTAGKTGTTNDYRDAWMIGYTPSIVTGVWVGNNDNRPMKMGASGGRAAAPIWHDYMLKVLGDTPKEEFREPEKIVTGKPVLDGEQEYLQVVKIDKESGLLATEYTPESYVEEKSFYNPHSILYYIDKNDPLSVEPHEPGKDEQFNIWEDAIMEWAASSAKALIEEQIDPEDEEPASSTMDIVFESAPTETDNVHLLENRPKFTIDSPYSNQTISDSLLYVNIVRASAPRGISRAEYYIDDQLIFTNATYPFNMVKHIGFLQNGQHKLKVKFCDDIDNCSESELNFNLSLDSEKRELIKTNLDWIAPSSGLAINNIDFPLSLQVRIGSPEQIKNLSFYFLKKGDSAPELIQALSSISNKDVTYKWDQVPVSGEYNIYAEVTMLDNQLVRNKGISVTINNFR